MINPNHKGLKLQICQKHSQPILGYQQKQPFCQVCIQEQFGIVPIDEFNKKLDEILSKENQENTYQLKLLQSLQDNITTYQININKQLDKIAQLIKEQIRIVEGASKQFQNIIEQSQNQQELIIQLEKELINKQEQNLQTKSIIGKLLSDFLQKYINFDHIFEILNQKQQQNELKYDEVIQFKKSTKNEIQASQQRIDRKFQYQLIEGQSKDEDNLCSAFAFNKDNTILAVGCYNKIVLYELNNSKINKEIQRLDDHNGYITCLYFTKNSNCFVSGSDDKSIIIWKLDSNECWVVQQILEDHNDYVNCILMNKKEDLLISGSDDKTVKFWTNQNGSWSCTQSIDLDNIQVALSLNEAENKLISCCDIIYIMEIQQQNQKWILTQKIDVCEKGLRLCFTIGNQFVFQPLTKDYLEVYDYDNINKKFFKSQQVQVQSCKDCYYYFPCQFIQQLNILQVKYGKCLNIFKIKEDGNYQLIQTIQYDHEYLFGCLSDDGQYLVTWDRETEQIRMRQLKYLE